MNASNANTPLQKSNTKRSFRSRMVDALFVIASSIINAWQLTTVTKLAWCGAFSAYTAIVGLDDSLTLLCACGMRLLTLKKRSRLGRLLLIELR